MIRVYNFHECPAVPKETASSSVYSFRCMSDSINLEYFLSLNASHCPPGPFSSASVALFGMLFLMRLHMWRGSYMISEFVWVQLLYITRLIWISRHFKSPVNNTLLF